MKIISFKNCKFFRQEGYTLVELIIVVSILAVLISFLLVAVHKVREAANIQKCSNNLRQLALGCHSFHDSDRRLPYSFWGVQNGFQYGAGVDSHAWSWLALILPHIEQADLYRIGDIPRSKLSDSDVRSKTVMLFLCPSDSSANSSPRTNAGNLSGYSIGNTNYKGVSGSNWGDDFDQFQSDKGAFFTDWRNVGANGSFDGLNNGDGLLFRSNFSRPISISQIADGASNTFFIGEDVPSMNAWVSWPYANNAHGTCSIPPNAMNKKSSFFSIYNWENTSGFRSRHLSGTQFAFADGSVKFIRDSINLNVYRAHSTHSGGETIPSP